MPVMEPGTSARNLTPTSVDEPSGSETTIGADELLQIETGPVMLTVTPDKGDSRLALSSAARLLIVTGPSPVAVPVTVTVAPLAKLVPGAGAVMVEVGVVRSVEALASIRPAWIVAGWTPMSARRLTVACFMLGSGVEPPSSWVPSRPQGHWTV